MKLKYKIIRYGILRRISTGIRLAIFPSYRCNFKCEYCTLWMSNNNNLNNIWPECKEVDLNDWLEFFKNFSIKIKEVFIYGGEPGMVKYIGELIRALLQSGILITVYTNLFEIKRFMNLPESCRLRFVATFHHNRMKENAFLRNYLELAGRYNIRLEEIEMAELRNSYIKQMAIRADSQSFFTDKNTLIVAPDLKIFCSCSQAYDVAKREKK